MINKCIAITTTVVFLLLTQITAASPNTYVWDVEDYQFPASLHKAQHAISVLWWNIQFGQTSHHLAEQLNDEVPPVDRNLLAIAQSVNAPDVIVLGEYTEEALEEDTVKALKKQYPYFPTTLYSYNAESLDRGLMIFSKYPFSEGTPVTLDYFPPEWDVTKDQERIRAYQESWKAKDPDNVRFFVRTYRTFTFQLRDKTISLVPAHMVMPFAEKIKEMQQGLISLESLMTEFMFSREHPLGYQVERLRQCLENDFGADLNSAPLLLIGDFNFIREFKEKTRHYAVLSKHLQDPFSEKQVKTWPAPSSVESMLIKGDYQIDHAFISNKLHAIHAEVLPFKGSDHFALYMTMQ